MRYGVVVGVLSLFVVTTASRGQTVSADEAYRRLQQRSAEHRPSTAPAPPPLYVKPAPKKVLALKDGAPPIVAKWFNSKETWRAKAIEEVRGQIADQEKRLKELLDTPIPQIQSGQTHMGPIYRPDSAAQAEQHKQAEEIRKAISDLKKTMREVETNPYFVYMPPLNDLALNEYGYIGPMVVKQITGDSEFLAALPQLDDKWIWFKGFSTKGVVDDQTLTYEKPVIISGTKQYTAALGTQKTVFVVEPFNVYDWLLFTTE